MNQEQIKQQLPEHLRQFVADQNYAERYSNRDQAVWRLVMKLLVKQLSASAHPVYFEGLEKTGISLDRIPTIDEVNICLARLGWRAIVVDGFIPPQAFMELQSLKVLAIALDMRSVEHILYTPAPDIIHEAAGHAPIIADVEYSDYLERFGEVGMRALYNRYDIELYEAVRTLSIVKESYPADAPEVTAAEQKLKQLSDNPGEPSELALLTRLHWWTVEYGLVGSPDDYKIFGAGLLSSLSESESCLDDKAVKKIPLTVEAIRQAYDITNQQPQLFVTKSCRHLTQVLDEFAATMCYQTGGTDALKQAAATGVVTTAELSSSIAISGSFNDPLINTIGEVIYFGTSGPTQLSVNGRELDGHGTQYHKDGFSSPLGRLCNLMKPLEFASEYELQELGILRDHRVKLEFLSGITVNGHLRQITKHHGTILLMSIDDCTVRSPSGDVLFDPSWGTYDMAVGDTIQSVFSGSADPTTFDVYPNASDTKQSKSADDKSSFDQLHQANESAQLQKFLADRSEDWLLHIEALSHAKTDQDSQFILEKLQDFADQEPLVERFLQTL